MSLPTPSPTPSPAPTPATILSSTTALPSRAINAPTSTAVQRASTGGGLRVPTNKKTIYDRNLNRSRTAELSRASFAFLFAEMIAYAQRNVRDIQDLEARLNAQGYPIGLRLLDLVLWREPPRQQVRPQRIVALLEFIHSKVWRAMFGRAADALERGAANVDEYMISDNDPVVNSYISVPKEMSQLNCAAYVAGVVEGVCDGCGFPARVSAHGVPTEMWPAKTVFLVKFQEDVLARERWFEKGGGAGR